MTSFSVKSIIFRLIVLIFFLSCAGCSAVSPLQNLSDSAQNNFFSNAQTVPQLNFQFALPNNWETEDVYLSSVGVQQSKLPVPTTGN